LVIGLQRSVLDELKKQIDITNQNLKAAEAAFQQAEWIVAQARAGYFRALLRCQCTALARRRHRWWWDDSGRGWRGRWQDHQLLQHIDHGELDPGFVGIRRIVQQRF